MRTLAQLKDRLKDYKGVEYIYRDYGFIAWQMGTGENVEIMFIETLVPRKGYGKRLVREMLKEIKSFNSVYVFRLERNEDAGKFYRSLGFRESLILNLYKENAVLGVVKYTDLCQNVLPQ